VREGYAPVENARLYYREVGSGQPIVVLHGGPDLSHTYLPPDLDRLSDSFRLVYYDQRGRGSSAGDVRPEDVSIESEIDDLEELRKHLGLESIAVLGHSWGGLLALEYALRHPDRLSHLILANTAPASRNDLLLFQRERRKSARDDLDGKAALAATAPYEAGDLETDAAYYRIHFRAAVRQPELLERVVRSLRSNFTPEGIRKARAIENRLYEETWDSSEYDLLPKLGRLGVPTLVIHGDYDIIPLACSDHVARAIPGARLVVLKECGHFSFLERPAEFRRAITACLTSRSPRS
jgi:proline iminopeptidase